ncbi:MAG: YdcF family protein [Cyanothece sp. SIO2G6]|nr:YdcF family protein [Cyanothece sp. SIO2G6]
MWCGVELRRKYKVVKRGQRWWRLAVAIALLVIGSHYYWQQRQIKPDAILVLGGAEEREHFAAEFAQHKPDLPIWVSSGSNQDYAEWVFAEAGISGDRLNLDYRAVDTVTNFTTLAKDFKTSGFDSVYVITSDYHMRRAWVIGNIVLGSQGIQCRPIPIESDRTPEPLRKVIRDGARSLLWVTTGHSGTTFGYLLRGEQHESRLPE